MGVDDKGVVQVDPLGLGTRLLCGFLPDEPADGRKVFSRVVDELPGRSRGRGRGRGRGLSGGHCVLLVLFAGLLVCCCVVSCTSWFGEWFFFSAFGSLKNPRTKRDSPCQRLFGLSFHVDSMEVLMGPADFFAWGCCVCVCTVGSPREKKGK